MLIDKPDWITHGDGVQPIFSVDVHPDGNRLASAGGDGMVVLWSVGHIFSKLRGNNNNKKKRLKKKAEAGQNGSKDDQANGEKENMLPENGSQGSARGHGSNGVVGSAAVEYTNTKVERVATLADHRGHPVNVARFSNSGRFVASGGDNHLVLIHELRPSNAIVGGSRNIQFSNGSSFGSQAVKNVENWVLCNTLTGHSNNVVDLGWCPDDSMVASCSLDNTVRIWDTLRGTVLTVLQEHTSFVKGVVWDPVGKYIASQSDDRSVVVRTVEGWETVACIKEPFEKAVWNTFSTRLDWCPDGSHITAVNTYQSPKNTAAILMRGSWERSHDYVGHKGPVVASRFNPRLFRVVSDEDKSKTYVASCIALGAQDNKVTVWLSQKARPVLVAKTFFNQSVVDLCWSPDGLTLFAASIDGTVAVFSFEEKELGERLSAKEVQDIMKDSYGTARLDRMGVAEDPALMELQEEDLTSVAAMKKSTEAKKAVQKKRPAPQPSASPAKPAVLVQTETVRASDGKRRIAPVPVGGAGGPIQTQRLGPSNSAAVPASPKKVAKKAKVAVPPGSRDKPRSSSSFRFDQEAFAAAAAKARPVIIPPACKETRPRLSVKVSQNRICEVQNTEKDIAGVPKELRISATVQCLESTSCLWSDKHLGNTVDVVSGCEEYLALGLGRGILQVYSKQGRRMWPPLSLGSPLAFMEMKRVAGGEGDLMGALILLAVTTDGKLWCWDLEREVCKLQSDVVPVALGEGSYRVKLVRLSEKGLPLVVLDSNHALVYSSKFSTWVRVADGSHLYSEFASGITQLGGSALSPGGCGEELNTLQTQAQAQMARSAGGAAARTLNMVTAAEQRRATGRHLEFMSQAAESLGDEATEVDWWCKLVKFLAQEGDQGKLREILDKFLQSDRKKMKSILSAIASVRSMQRLVTEYLDIVNSE
ncbi:protein HIRA [Chloropicon primus]|uniref:Protein HIRA n=1 Tax=Chloropicon primus TaxID=1764295 RepID=A0A5B8MUR8_9CHLO|nr:WD40 repeat domain-containing protein [Chloropicon primus]UPR03756.1 protein HIRA [Chloropicon primus]|mmetsp:Transcript_11979/g.33121  ORF Transcript_11979/g.33121 Transcript_11979/m.33121 type:complete len:931 (-) Transcript_11979:83-2875(-)|eukprot:QDZ24548.1 WD40 repeat domain-containing protein [Chloropicon primus]